MPLILGVDAAWTETGSSGVALLDCANDWRLIACAPSYSSFIAHADSKPICWHRPQPSPLDATKLLKAAEELGGGRVDVVAIDMPIASVPFSSRRAADQEISRKFGSAWAGTHSPNANRPGEYGRRVSTAFVDAGYPLVTSQRRSPALIEIYPLAALVRLLNVARRPIYKVSKCKAGWPDLTRDQRIAKLLEAWGSILECLNQGIVGLEFPVPEARNLQSLSALKPYEDALDAVISSYVGALFLSGSAQAYGDAEAAIWVPKVAALRSVKDTYLAAVHETLPEWDAPSDSRAFRTL
jgi:predicted RNase H-like nuclease